MLGNEHGINIEIANNSTEPSWRRSLANAVRSYSELCDILDLPISVLIGSDDRQAAEKKFPLLIPRSFIARMKKGDAADPLLLQVMSRSIEMKPTSGFVDDAVGDLAARKSPGLLQKYYGRALLMVTGNCAVHCRYCFRRQYPYQNEPRKLADLIAALDSVRADRSLTEIILSGGDPLLVSDEKLEGLLQAIAKIPQIARVRIHSRLPIVLPDRITDSLVGILRSTRLRVVFVIHANHANELVGDCRAAIEKMVDAGIPVLNQSVLLAGVNDSFAALADLSEQLIECGAMPYYLHVLDRVTGTAHFEVSAELGKGFIEEMRKQLPGYAVPRLVREEAGASSKTIIS